MKIIFILGMGRSGTSAMTRVLSLCGAALPERILRPSAANPLGYFEPEISLKRNDAFLASLGSSYHDPGLGVVAAAAVRSKRRKGFERHIADFLLAFSESDTPVIKDPRISGFADIWFDVATRLGHEVCVVHMFRHPDEVAASLAQRYGISAEYAQALWLKYNLLPERASRAIPRIFVSYERLLAEWRPVVQRCSKLLGLPLRVDGQGSGRVDEFLRSDLRHQTALASPTDTTPGGWVSRTYACLLAAAERAAEPAEFERIHREYAAGEAWLQGPLAEYARRFPLPLPDAPITGEAAS